MHYHSLEIEFFRLPNMTVSPSKLFIPTQGTSVHVPIFFGFMQSQCNKYPFIFVNLWIFLE